MKAACQIMDEKRGVKISEVAYAVGYNEPRYFTATFKKEIGIVDGGTGWAVQMAIDDGKPVHLYDQERDQWFINRNGEWGYDDVPTLTDEFAGIGSRKINDKGREAIKAVYEKTFGF